MARLENWGQTTVSKPSSVPNYSRDRETVVCPQLPVRGFTLFELLVVMALLGVATLIATGGAEPIVRAARERGWIDRLHAELVRTRSYSRASGTVTVASFVPGQEEIRFVTGSRTRLLALPDGFRFGSRFETATGGGEQAQTQTQTLVFFPDGTASDLELIVTGSAGRTTRLRVVGATGKIELTPLESRSEPMAEPPA
jgi:prepilin-type N-terminal cleavage/methylation domain-containing protein